MRKLFFILVFSVISQVNSQELNCLVIVDAQQAQNSNTQTYSNLKDAVSEFMNNTRWTTNKYKPQEKINCSITLFVTKQISSNEFDIDFQIQASRPVFNSTYQTPIFNYRDEKVRIVYNEYEPLIYNETSFESNLISILTFYAYTILGIDADTFAPRGGEKFYKLAENVVNQAQQGGYSGWNRIDGSKTRYQLNENLLSPVYKDYRDLLYTYHLKGLDVMSENKKEAKKNIAAALMKLQNIYNRRANAYLLRVFIDAKSDEIVDIFSDGPRINTANLKEMLLKVYPTFNAKWEKIKS
ncbi:MAG TPA: DUF4835 family protein [Flavobacteriia bacterium]|jgi:hypothetical protein|nr:DUF4835 family protein [Flavobacteriia bacterium]